MMASAARCHGIRLPLMAPAAGCVGLRLPKLMSLSLRCLDDIPLMSALLLDVCWADVNFSSLHRCLQAMLFAADVMLLASMSAGDASHS